MNIFEKLSVAFAAGTFGGIANGLIVWGFGVLGIAQALGVAIAPPLAKPFIYNKLVWGGIWGFAFLIPMMHGKPWLRGLVISLGPSIVMLLVVFPMVLGKGVLGLTLGALTPVLVLIYNAVWGLAAVWWLKRVGFIADGF
jgi:hypothetical protein